MISTAFVLGAGLGTRLRPLTNVRPKPLIPVCNKPLIAWTFEHLMAHGIDRFVVNTHWLSAAYATEFPEQRYKGAEIVFRDEQPEVLETAGGLKNVEDLLESKPFIVYNGDIFCDISLDAAIAAHLASGNEATLVLRSKDGPLQVAFDAPAGRIVDIGDRLGAAKDAQRFLFTGITVTSPAFLTRIPPATKLSVIPIFIQMIQQNAKLGAIVADDGTWWDLGSREKYLAVHEYLAQQRPELVGRPPWVAATAMIEAGAEIAGATAIGAGARIGSRAALRDCIVWPGATIEPGCTLERCIVTGANDAPISGAHKNIDL